jgi:hypothetical protein
MTPYERTIMHATVISAGNIKQDDHFFLAGVLYKVCTIKKHSHQIVEIRYTDASKRFNEEGGSEIHTMGLREYTTMQILRT